LVRILVRNLYWDSRHMFIRGGYSSDNRTISGWVEWRIGSSSSSYWMNLLITMNDKVLRDINFTDLL
jgi:hypothetical protein